MAHQLSTPRNGCGPDPEAPELVSPSADNVILLSHLKSAADAKLDILGRSTGRGNVREEDLPNSAMLGFALVEEDCVDLNLAG